MAWSRRANRLYYFLVSIGTPVLILLAVEAWRSHKLAHESWRAGMLRMVADGIVPYHSWTDSYPPFEFTGNDGKPTTSWRIYFVRFMDAHRHADPFDPDVNWNEPPNSVVAAINHPLFCIDGKRGSTAATVFAIDCADSLFSGVDIPPEELPLDLVIVVWVNGAPGLNWTAPGDICCDGHTGVCHVSQDQLPKDVEALFVFRDREDWRTVGLDNFKRASKFASLSYAREFDRDQVLSEPAHRFVRPK